MRARSGTAPAHQGSAVRSWCTSVPGDHPDTGVLAGAAAASSANARRSSRPGRDPLLGKRLVGVPQGSRDDRGRLSREVPREDVHPVTLLGQPDGTGQPGDPGSDHDDSLRPASHRASMAGRFSARETRRCALSGRLRRAADRAPADGHPGADAQVRRLGAGALRRRLLQAAELDEPAVHRPRGHHRGRPGRVDRGRQDRRQPADPDRGGPARLQPRPRRGPRPAEGRRREAPPGAARRAPGDPGRRPHVSYAGSSRPPSARST